MAEKLFLRRPPNPAQRIPELYIEVDPEMGCGWMTTLYRLERNAGKSIGNRYVPVHGAECLFSRDINVQPILDGWNECFDTVRATLEETTGEATTFAKEAEAVLTKLPKLVSALGQSREVEAHEIAHEIGYDLLQCFTTAVALISGLAIHAEQQSGIAEGMLAAVEGNDVEHLYEYVALSLANDISNALEAVARIRKYEEDTRFVLDSLGATNQAWEETLRGRLSGQFAWLASSDADGFRSLAPQALVENSPEQIVNLIQRTQSVIGEIMEELATARRDFGEAKQLLEAIWHDQPEVERALATFTRSREAMSQFKTAGLKTFMVVRELLDHDKFEQWEELKSDPLWRSSYAIQSRLRQSQEAVNQLSNVVPEIPAEQRQYLQWTESYLVRLNEKLKTPETNEEQNTATAPVATVTVLPPALSQSIREAGTFSPLRLDEIHNLAKAIAAVLFCNKHSNCGVRVSVLLDLMYRAELLNEEEKSVYATPLQERLLRESYIIKGGDSPGEKWEKLNPRTYRWIHFTRQRGPRTFAYFRLIKKAQSEGLALLVSFGVAEAALTAIYEERKSELAERRQTRLSSQ